MIIGGPHVTFTYEGALAGSVDFVARSEGKLMAPELRAPGEGIKGPKRMRGLACKGRGGKIVMT